MIKKFIEFINEDETKYTLICSKCKSVEDTFTKDEKIEDFGWSQKGKKVYCPSCTKDLENKK